MQNFHHLGARELRRDVGALAEHAALVGAGNMDLVFLAMRAGFRRRHAIALGAVKGDIDFQGLSEQRICVDLIKDVMRIERPVVVADTGMVAPDNQMRAAVVLAD